MSPPRERDVCRDKQQPNASREIIIHARHACTVEPHFSPPPWSDVRVPASTIRVISGKSERRRKFAPDLRAPPGRNETKSPYLFVPIVVDARIHGAYPRARWDGVEHHPTTTTDRDPRRRKESRLLSFTIPQYRWIYAIQTRWGDISLHGRGMHTAGAGWLAPNRRPIANPEQVRLECGGASSGNKHSKGPNCAGSPQY